MHAAFDTHTLKLHPRASALAEEHADIVLFANWRTLVATEEGKFNEKRTRARSTGERLAWATGSPAFTAKNRYGIGADSFPLSWPALMAAMTPAAPAA